MRGLVGGVRGLDGGLRGFGCGCVCGGGCWAVMGFSDGENGKDS